MSIAYTSSRSGHVQDRTRSHAACKESGCTGCPSTAQAVPTSSRAVDCRNSDLQVRFSELRGTASSSVAHSPRASPFRLAPVHKELTKRAVGLDVVPVANDELHRKRRGRTRRSLQCGAVRMRTAAFPIEPRPCPSRCATKGHEPFSGLHDIEDWRTSPSIRGAKPIPTRNFCIASRSSPKSKSLNSGRLLHQALANRPTCAMYGPMMRSDASGPTDRLDRANVLDAEA